jgi:hypothetical protein
MPGRLLLTFVVLIQSTLIGAPARISDAETIAEMLGLGRRSGREVVGMDSDIFQVVAEATGRLRVS